MRCEAQGKSCVIRETGCKNENAPTKSGRTFLQGKTSRFPSFVKQKVKEARTTARKRAKRRGAKCAEKRKKDGSCAGGAKPQDPSAKSEPWGLVYVFLVRAENGRNPSPGHSSAGIRGRPTCKPDTWGSRRRGEECGFRQLRRKTPRSLLAAAKSPKFWN